MLQVLHCPLKAVLLLSECFFLRCQGLDLRLKAIGYLTREIFILHLSRVEGVIQKFQLFNFLMKLLGCIIQPTLSFFSQFYLMMHSPKIFGCSWQKVLAHHFCLVDFMSESRFNSEKFILQLGNILLPISLHLLHDFFLGVHIPL